MDSDKWWKIALVCLACVTLVLLLGLGLDKILNAI